MIEIDKGVPLPPAASRAPKYPWAAMEVGDSFFAQGVTGSALASAGRQHADWHKLQRKYTVRKIDGGYRVWRTE